MSVFALLLLSQATPWKAAFARYTAYRHANPVISADWSISTRGKEVSHGTILLQGEKRVLFKSLAPADPYSLSETEKGVIELQSSNQVYDEFPPQPRIVALESRISGGTQFLPLPLFREVIDTSRTEYSSDGQESIDGMPVDVVKWSVAVEGGSLKYRIFIDSKGRIVKMTRQRVSDGPGVKMVPHMSPFKNEDPLNAVVWRITNYQSKSSLPLTAYYTPLPMGYVPYAIPPSSSIGIEVDMPFPAMTWKEAGKVVDFKAISAGKPALLLVTAPDCAPSHEAISNLGLIRHAASGAVFKAVSLSRTAAGASGLPFDSNGKIQNAFGETSTPLFVLIDKSGKVANLWTGYDPNSQTKFEKEIESAIKTLSEKK
jgi:hypothetical protein